ncbi:MAG: polysaccharide deacetylase family protein [Rhodocyclaceae bacterium]
MLPLAQAIKRLRQGELPARAAAITFDDGYADNYLHALPILRKHGLPATVFVATGFLDGGRMWNDTIIESIRGASVPVIDAGFIPGLTRLPVGANKEKQLAIERIIAAIKHRPAAQRLEIAERTMEACQSKLDTSLMLSSEQVRALRQAGMDIGAHTITHPILASLDKATARREIAESREFLEGLLGEKIPLFAYPNGAFGRDYLPEHVELVKTLGFAAAVTTNWGASSVHSDIFQLPRFTPWDKQRSRCGLRLWQNYRRTYPGSDSGSSQPA